MDEVLRLKFEQHSRLKRELLATGDAELVEVSQVYGFQYQLLMQCYVHRIPTRTLSGELERTGRGEMNLGKLLCD